MTISISLSGPAFSFLLYENSKGGLKQEGFLLGEIIHEETRTITDNDQQQVNISKVIKINSVLPCPQSGNYFSKGKINKNKIRNFLGNDFSKVIAWYKYSLSNMARFTLKDKMIHKQLREFFQTPHDLFSCCLLTTDASPNLATYTFTHSFLRYYNGFSERLNVQIPNLSEKNNTYRTPEAASETFNNIIKDLKLNTKTTQGVVAITNIQNALQKHINNIVDELSEAEKMLFELEVKVGKLKTDQDDVEMNENVSEKSKVGKLKTDQDDVVMNENVSEKSEELNSIAENDVSSIEASSSQGSTTDSVKKTKSVRARGRKKSSGNEEVPREIRTLRGNRN